LISTLFNATANNFKIILNRREVAKKLSLKLVKEQKRKNRHVNYINSKNNNTDISK